MAEQGNGKPVSTHDATGPPQDEWLAQQLKLAHRNGRRFPLEWISEADEAGAEQLDLQAREHFTRRQRRQMRLLAWLVLGVGWLTGVAMGAAFMAGVTFRQQLVRPWQQLRVEQMALTNGYRALLFKPCPAAMAR